MGNNAVVVLSGGQDSVTALFWAQVMFDEVAAVTFDYGQRHKVELESAKKAAEIADVNHEILDARFINTLAPNALTRSSIPVEAPEGKLPTTFVPGRNLFFLSMAAVYARRLDIENLVMGVCMIDFSGYPDCRNEFILSAEKTISLAMDYPFKVHTPMMFLKKADEVRLALELGPDCMKALAWSHTCYEGKAPPCGECPACKLRAKGFAEAGVPDPLIERLRTWCSGPDD